MTQRRSILNTMVVQDGVFTPSVRLHGSWLEKSPKREGTHGRPKNRLLHGWDQRILNHRIDRRPQRLVRCNTYHSACSALESSCLHLRESILRVSHIHRRLRVLVQSSSPLRNGGPKPICCDGTLTVLISNPCVFCSNAAFCMNHLRLDCHCCSNRQRSFKPFGNDGGLVELKAY